MKNFILKLKEKWILRKAKNNCSNCDNEKCNCTDFHTSPPCTGYKSTSWEDFKRELLTDPEFKKEYTKIIIEEVESGIREKLKRSISTQSSIY